MMCEGCDGVYLGGVNELLDDVCSLDDGELSEDVAHDPEGESVEQLNAFLNTRGSLAGLGIVGVYTKLTQL